MVFAIWYPPPCPTRSFVPFIHNVTKQNAVNRSIINQSTLVERDQRLWTVKSDLYRIIMAKAKWCFV